MEERVPSVGDPKDDPPPLFTPPPPPPPPPFREEEEEEEEDNETYIVQIPRDQIYRVPPPENAVIAESYRKPQNQKSGCGGGNRRRCLWMSVSIGAVGLIIGTIIGCLQLFSTPQTPGFSITKALHKNHKHYEISLKAHNPNDKTGVSYKKGVASLLFKHHKIADGSCPSFSQEAKESTTVRLTLAGSSLPSEIKKSINDTKTPLSLSLKINVPIQLKSLIITSTKDVTVTCDFRVNTLAATGRTRILSQQCHI